MGLYQKATYGHKENDVENLFSTVFSLRNNITGTIAIPTTFFLPIGPPPT